MRVASIMSCYLSRDRALTGTAVFVLLALACISLRLGAMRIIQVDECNNVFVAKVLANGQAQTTIDGIDLFQIPLSWIVKHGRRSIDLFTSARFVMLEVFWLNILLITIATGEKILSVRGLVSFGLASTLAPLWDYGFEIRHDNVLLTGILFIWCSIRFGNPGLIVYAVTGGLTVLLQFIAFKAFVYTLPIALAILAFPPPSVKLRRWKIVVAWLFGAGLVFLLVRAGYQSAGYWDIFMRGFRGMNGVAISANRFGAWFPLARLLEQTPLLLAAVTAASFLFIAQLCRVPRKILTWDSCLPESLLLAAAFFALLANPTPFPYNLVNLVPFMFIFALRYFAMTWETTRPGAPINALLFSVVLFAHLVPFAKATERHWTMSNSRQERVMSLAEDLTDPIKDPVFEGIGMVPTRPIINRLAFLHSLNIQSFRSGRGPRLRDFLTLNPAAVIIPSYRTDWLPDEDHEFIDKRYVKLADDLLVLGQTLPPGGGEITIVHPGRYRITCLRDSNIWQSYPDTMDGFLSPKRPEPLSAKIDETLELGDVPIYFSEGKHTISTTCDQTLAVVWVGPNLDRPPRAGEADHQKLFVNWY
jgi:hypothetical protein